MLPVTARDLLPFVGADNNTNILIFDHLYNKTVINYWNYTLYSNNTISNGSSCFLVFPKYMPDGLLPNGTWVNATTCYQPINPMGPRSLTGIGFAVLFAASIMFIMIHLRKHGRLFLPSEKRFRAVGRRWQWYWLLFVAAFGLISCITGVDVDRDYLPDLALILQLFFYFLMLPATLSAIWESVRHW